MKLTPLMWCGIAVALFLTFLFFDFRAKTTRQNDSAALGRLRLLNQAQLAYAAKNPEKGFACNLSDLSENEQYSGYRFMLSCDGSARGKVTTYHIVAQPLELGKTGLRTYCVTEAEHIWYDRSGSADNCLSARQPIER